RRGRREPSCSYRHGVAVRRGHRRFGRRARGPRTLLRQRPERQRDGVRRRPASLARLQESDGRDPGPSHAAAVRLVEDAMVVEPNRIYLIPPKKEMIISGGKLLLSERDRDQELTLPIDVFFRSLAQDCGRRAIGVVLSGGRTVSPQ